MENPAAAYPLRLAIVPDGRLATGSGLVVRGNVLRSVEAEVTGTALGDGGAPLQFRVRADSVEASGRAFDRIEADGSWHDRTLAADVRARQDSLVSYAALGTFARPRAAARRRRRRRDRRAGAPVGDARGAGDGWTRDVA